MGTSYQVREWIRHLPLEDRLQRFDRWRADIPWTNEEVAVAWDQASEQVPNEFLKVKYHLIAGRVRAGFLNKYTLSGVLPTLIQACAICGKKALYRSGYRGYCRDHRQIAMGLAMAHFSHEGAKNLQIARHTAAFDDYDIRRTSLKACKRGRK